MIRIKICGMRRPEDAQAAAAAGADAIGLVFAPSPRRVAPGEARQIVAALPPFISKVGVFVNEDLKRVCEVTDYCGLDCLQFHGQERPEYLAEVARTLSRPVQMIKAWSVRQKDDLKDLTDYPIQAILLDAYVPNRAGGGGKTFPWSWAREVPRAKLILAGGLSAANVTQALGELQPFGVDVSSGVESNGWKDAAKIKEFVQIIRRWEYGK